MKEDLMNSALDSDLAKKQRLILLMQVFFTCMICGWFMVWMTELPFDQGPDERMRFLIPNYIYNHGKLPTGYDAEVIYNVGNWSYAFYPQMLGALLSAFFMKVMSLFQSTPEALLYAARFTSVLFGGITVFFTGRSVYKLSGNFGLSLLGMTFLGFLPQFTFLSCYVNNDVIAAAGASLIVYALVEGCFETWGYRQSLYLSLGFIVCALGYMNSYGFILVGGLFFLIVNYLSIKYNQLDKKTFYKNFALIFVVCAVAIFPFLIRNFVLYKDIFGMSVFREEYLKWVAENGYAIQKPYEHGNLLTMLTDWQFIEYTLHSCIAFFGYMSIRLNINYYHAYYCIFGLGIAGFVLYAIRRHFKPQPISLVQKRKHLAFGLIALGCLITCGLHWYYSLNIDYQPQGRYIVAIVSPFMILLTLGFERIINFFIQPRKKRYIYFVLMALYIGLNVVIHDHYFILSQNIGQASDWAILFLR